MQISSQIDEPDYGTLLDSMRYTCTPGQVLEIPASRFIARASRWSWPSSSSPT
jgi:2-oxo-hept-3-ene-1,7-dioate hydratase